MRKPKPANLSPRVIREVILLRINHPEWSTNRIACSMGTLHINVLTVLALFLLSPVLDYKL